MRDAFGGAFMIQIFLVFILIYVSFTALALNYAKAFKVKNRIIEYIETNEQVNISDMTAQELINMETFFEEEIHGKMNYYGSLECTNTEEEKYCKNGIQIVEQKSGTNTIGKYYKVTTSFGWSIQFFNVINKISGKPDKEAPFSNWKISGETRLIVNN